MQDNKQSNIAAAGGLRTDLVSDIPVTAQGTAQKRIDDDEELDKIMRDVGKDVKEVGKKPAKHHWFSKDSKSKTDPKFSARPIDQIKPLPAAPLKPVQAAQPTPKANPKAVPKAQAKAIKTSRTPIGAIVLAIIVAGGLSAAAYYAYK